MPLMPDRTAANSVLNPSFSARMRLAQTARRSPFRGKALEVVIAIDQGHSQFTLQLRDRRGQRRLRHVAGLGSAREVSLPSDRGKVFKLAKLHALPPRSRHDA